MPTVNTRYYGNNFKSFYGRVVNVNDPLQLGRVQVRIFGIHTENETDKRFIKVDAWDVLKRRA